MAVLVYQILRDSQNKKDVTSAGMEMLHHNWVFTLRCVKKHDWEIPFFKSMDPWPFQGNSMDRQQCGGLSDLPCLKKPWIHGSRKLEASWGWKPIASWNGNATNKNLSRKNRGFKTWRQHRNFKTHTITLNFDELERCQTINHQDRANNHGFVGNLRRRTVLSAPKRPNTSAVSIFAGQVAITNSQQCCNGCPIDLVWL